VTDRRLTGEMLIGKPGTPTGSLDRRLAGRLAGGPALAGGLVPTVGLAEAALDVDDPGTTPDLGVPLENSEDHAAVTLGSEAYAELVELVGRIRDGRTDGMAELYQLFSKGIRFYLCRQLGPQEIDDKVHDTFVVVVQAIRKGELREPQRLMGFVRTIVRRQVAAHIDRVVHSRREQTELDSGARVADPRGNPEEAAMFQQRSALIKQVLGELSRRDREILTRFYLDEESQEQICQEMSLSETQFRLLKSRAKARFGELGKKKLTQKSFSPGFLRNSAASSH
jgi:RNA polymerase sigma-70 factor, ECF subfamily